MTRLTTIVLPLAAAALLLAGCGGGGDGGAGDAGTITGFEFEDEVGGDPGPFESSEFQPPVSFTVPEGWRPREDFGMIQVFRGAGEAQAITFESLGEGDLAQRVEQMRNSPELQPGEAEQTTIGGRDAVTFEAEPTFAIPVEGSQYFALGQGPLRVHVIDVDGMLVGIFTESSVLRTERREAEQVTAEFFSEAQRIVDTVEFGDAPSGTTTSPSGTTTSP